MHSDLVLLAGYSLQQNSLQVGHSVFHVCNAAFKISFYRQKHNLI